MPITVDGVVVGVVPKTGYLVVGELANDFGGHTDDQ